MNCEQFREEIELAFGEPSLPAELQAHIESCAECRRYGAELEVLAARLRRESADRFPVSRLGATATEVERRIAEIPPTVIIPLSRLRWITRVAAAVLVVAASMAAYRIGRYDGLRTAASEQTTLASGLSAATDTEEESIDERAVSVLIEDYSARGFFGASEALIDDLSDEEWQYLMDNLKVGELL